MLLVFLVDIIAITLLADTSGGMTSGLPALLVITVAASAVLISNRKLAMLVAAVSVLAILLDTAWLILRDVLDIGSLFPAGLLGLLVFGVALMVQTIAHRLGRAEELARNRSSDLYNLQRLNEQIVQHMQTGILLVNNEGLVRVMNKSAIRLLTPERQITEATGRAAGRLLCAAGGPVQAVGTLWQPSGYAIHSRRGGQPSDCQLSRIAAPR